MTRLRVVSGAGTASTATGREEVRQQEVEATVQWQLRSGTDLALVVPWVLREGPQGTARGLGDVLAALDQRLGETAWGELRGVAGIRLPTGDDDQLQNAPLAYQPGLGSVDVLAGVAWHQGPWDARAGYVTSVGDRGGTAPRVQRGDDVVLVAGYRHHLDAVTLRGGGIVAHRLADSSVRTAEGVHRTVHDSAGTQANATLEATWTGPLRTTVALTGEKALLAREEHAHIDGLTRSWSVGLGVGRSW